jgi:hypothetical protein
MKSINLAEKPGAGTPNTGDPATAAVKTEI